MADYSEPFGTISQSGASQDIKANSLFDALCPAACYGLNGATTAALTLGMHGGKILLSGVITTINNQTIALTASATNYVEAHPDTGAVSKNITAFTPGYLPVATVSTNTTGIVPSTGYVDQRTLSLATNVTLTKAPMHRPYAPRRCHRLRLRRSVHTSGPRRPARMLAPVPDRIQWHSPRPPPSAGR